ncbi:3-phosphoshikimate 1-carboxyvinyltransferase [Mycoplasmatota bacterium WC44]
MSIKLKPSFLEGEVVIPPSKSYSHRAIICASLANGKSKIDNIILSDDILATINALRAIGAKIEINDNCLNITGVEKIDLKEKLIDCNESGSTIRFMIPVLMLSGYEFHITGKESLMNRPMSIYDNLINELNGVYLKKENTLKIKCDLTSKEYTIPGNISSQFISGLLFVLPLLDGDSKIIIENEFESLNYVLMTIEVMKKFGVKVILENNVITIKGNQKYKETNYYVEGDFSQMAFFAVAGIINGNIKCLGMNHNSIQGDKAIVKVLKQMGSDIEVIDSGYIFRKGITLGKEINISQTPDLGPIIGLVSALSIGVSKIVGAERLRIKESDRLESTFDTLTKLGVDVIKNDDSLIITGKGSLKGNIVDSYNDHRIAMMATIASLRSDSIIELTNANVINKSYPNFYEDFKSLGGIIED